MKIFETDQYSMGWHRLRVAYYSPDNTSVPLLLQYLLIQNGTLLDFTSSSSIAVPTSTTWSSPTSNRSTPPNKGTIIGGGIGGVICLLAFLVLLFIYRRRHNAEASMVKVNVPFIVEESQLSHNTAPPRGKEPAVFSSDSHLNSADNRPGFTSSRKARRLIGDTLSRASHQEEHPPAQNEGRNYSQNLPEKRIVFNGQIVGPSVHQLEGSGGTDLTNQELPGTMEDLPPAYSPG